MQRRALLAMTGAVTTTLFGGCVDSLTDSGPADQDDTTSPSGDDEGAHHLFVENHTDTTETGRVTVADEDGSMVVDDRFEFPDGRGIKFRNVADWETTYTVTIDVDGEDAESMDWTTPGCGPDSESPGDTGSRNGAVRIHDLESAEQDDRFTFVVDVCDAIKSPSVSVGPADSFRLDD